MLSSDRVLFSIIRSLVLNSVYMNWHVTWFRDITEHHGYSHPCWYHIFGQNQIAKPFLQGLVCTPCHQHYRTRDVIIHQSPYTALIVVCRMFGATLWLTLIDNAFYECLCKVKHILFSILYAKHLKLTFQGTDWCFNKYSFFDVHVISLSNFVLCKSSSKHCPP